MLARMSIRRAASSTCRLRHATLRLHQQIRGRLDASPSRGRREECRWHTRSVKFHEALEGHQRHDESARNLTLTRIAIDDELDAAEMESSQGLAIVDEDRQVSVEVADLSLSTLESDFRSDVRNAGSRRYRRIGSAGSRPTRDRSPEGFSFRKFPLLTIQKSMKLPSAILAGVTSLLIAGCTIGPPPQRGYDAEVNVEQAGVRLLRNGMTVCLIRTQLPNVENWKLINGNTEIVIKSRGRPWPCRG